MEVRMHPLSTHGQRCFTFRLSVAPPARIFSFQDHFGNQVHHFDVPHPHRNLSIVADALVSLDPAPPLPLALPVSAWEELSSEVRQSDHQQMLMPSEYARESSLLDELAFELDVVTSGGRDPLTLVRQVSVGVYGAFTYVRKSTGVNSPIDASLEIRQGVCQDFAHVMIALVRRLGIPCRYVSGYLYQGGVESDRSSEGATHAWVEAWLPTLGWVGFDPTNNGPVADRHIRTATGRDYADVPPTRGTMKGRAETELQVGVLVTPSQTLLPADATFATDQEWSLFLQEEQPAAEEDTQGAQQQ
jgi:transglutaminase-like putative cysteine protease